MINALWRAYIRDWNFGRWKECCQSGSAENVNVAVFLVYGAGGSLLSGLLFAEKEKDLWEQIVILCMWLAVFFVSHSIMLHAVRPAKIYYLCPLSPDERFRYVKRCYQFRCLLHFVAFAAADIVILLRVQVNIYALIFLLVNELIFSCLSPVDDREKGAEKGHLILLFLEPVLMFSIMVYTAWLLEPAETEAEMIFYIIVSVLVHAVVTLPLFFAWQKWMRRAFKRAASYEEVSG